jgi:hypothetical protein
MVKNDGEISTATLEACLYLTDVLARYAIIEQRYRAGDDQCSPSFKNAIIRGYKAVLEYCAAVKVVKDSGTARKFLALASSYTDYSCSIPQKLLHFRPPETDFGNRPGFN